MHDPSRVQMVWSAYYFDEDIHTLIGGDGGDDHATNGSVHDGQRGLRRGLSAHTRYRKPQAHDGRAGSHRSYEVQPAGRGTDMGSNRD